ncbi:ABC transporter ATP-binding protein [Campylobacter majalis]|uniref:ABC transporter ATP-binding protein n=1 Tax=Campylobacter majalis TaxID=2790656 RepID=UPI003D697127
MQTKSILSLYKTFLQISANHEKAYKKSLFSSILAILFESAFLLCFFEFFIALTQNNHKILTIVLVIMSVAFLLFMVFKFKSANYDHGGVFIDVGYDFRKKLGKKLTNLPLQTLTRYKTGELNAMLSSSVDEAVMFMNMIPSMFLEPVIIAISIFLVSLFYAPYLSLIVAIAFPIAFWLYKLRRKLAIAEKDEFIKANAKLESQIIEYIQGIGVLRSLNLVGANSKNLNKSIENVKLIQQKAANISALPTIAFGFIGIGVMMIALCVGVYLNQAELVGVGVVIAVLVISSSVIEPMSVLLPVASLFDLIDMAFKHTNEILNLKELQTSKPHSVPKNFDIEFDDVSFAYEKSNANALTNVSFKIPQNSLTAIVGASGSGKSTITKLLMRYADCDQGSIKIGGIDIKNIPQNELFKLLSVVFQDVYLFDDSIKNNILMANLNADENAVKQAGISANCDEFVSRLKDGYDSVVGDMGKNLSGGEKQRISIARAILKGAPIIMLDEPTAALDTQSEAGVQKAINALVKDQTILIIAHRLSTIMKADQILVFDKSRLVQKGTHDELIKDTTGKYYQMWQSAKSAKSWKISSNDV